jgi:hypothetical protein
MGRTCSMYGGEKRYRVFVWKPAVVAPDDGHEDSRNMLSCI